MSLVTDMQFELNKNDPNCLISS